MRIGSPTAYGANQDTLSVHLLLPFARLVPSAPRDLEIETGGAVNAAIFADPSARIPESLYRRLLRRWRDETGDAALGIRAAQLIGAADFAVIYLAVRNSANIREALLCFARYTELLADGLTGVLVEDSERAIWQLRYAGTRPLAITNDFMVISSWYALRDLLELTVLLEVHFQHETATDAAEYARVLPAAVRFGQAHNALVFPRSALDAPLSYPNRDLFEVFNQRAQQLLEQQRQGTSLVSRVKQLLRTQIDEGAVNITGTARRLQMSSITLQRRLAEHGTNYTELLDQVRRALALDHLSDQRLSISEIAFRLGFSTQSAFGRAFRRWFGVSPLAYRQTPPGEASHLFVLSPLETSCFVDSLKT